MDAFFVGLCELNASETISPLIECMIARSNALRGRPAATARHKGSVRRKRDTGAERSETAEGKIEELAPGRRGTASAQGLRRHSRPNRGVAEMSTACMLVGAGATRDWRCLR